MTRRDRRKAFTLVELLVVMVLISVLAALLIPAITGAIRTAKNAAVTSDIGTLSQALAAFKEKYGDYPPSRIMLSENGRYDTDGSAGKPAAAMVVSGSGTAGADITYADLAQRSIGHLRKFFPRVQLTTIPTATAAPGITAANWYDFDGDGVFQDDASNADGFYGYILEGDECLTFFLGGIPLNTGSGSDAWSMTGLGKDPRNPFKNNLTGAANYDGNRLPPLFEFRNERLRDMDDPAKDPVRFPSYFDSLATDAPFAYFSAYGGNRYDPNDCNWAPRDATGAPAGAERDDAGKGPYLRGFRVAFPIKGSTANLAISAAPNPYHTSGSPTTVPTTQWHKGSSFQLISAGADGLYGPGGTYKPGDPRPLPVDPGTLSGATWGTPQEQQTRDAIRSRENDNLSSFAGGRLE